MKKFNIFFRGIALMLFLMTSLSSFSQNCEYTLEMNDSFGDGWNGFTMDVTVDGNVVLDNATVPSGGSQNIETFLVSDGAFVVASMNSGGSFASEVSWNIFDSEDGFVTSGGAFSTQTFTASCPAACPGQATINGASVSTDCANQNFFVDIDFVSADAAFQVTDGTTNWTIVSGNGVLQVGPFNSGEIVNLTIDEVEITSQDIEGWLVANQGGLTVALDVTITDDLRKEGNARELINRVQNLRKESGFDVTDKIKLIIQKNVILQRSIEANQDYIKTETLTSELVFEEIVEKGTEIAFDDVNTKILIQKM